MNAFNRRSFLSAACAGGLATTFAPSLSFAQTATDRRFVFVLDHHPLRGCRSDTLCRSQSCPVSHRDGAAHPNRPQGPENRP